MRTRDAVLVASLLVMAACGNTMQAKRESAGDIDASTLAASPSGAPRTQTTSAGSNLAPPSGAPAASTGPASAGATTGVAGRARPAAPGAIKARGITDTTIAIGIGTVDVAALTTAYAPGAETGSTTVQESVQAIIDYMNRHGGILNRKIVANYHDFPINELVNPPAEQRREQAMCDDFTLDRPSFAALPLVSASGIFNNCAAERGLITIDTNNLGENVDDQRYREIASVWYRPNWLTGEHRERVYVDQLARRGFFDKKGSKYGVLIFDDPKYKRTYETAMLPALARHGVKPTETFVYGTWDDGNAAVLRFKTAGITHVMWSNCTCGGLNQATFMNSADSQDYHPLYGFSTDLNIGAFKGIGASAEQMQSSVAFGWNPSNDGVTLADPITPVNQKCRDAMKEAGLDGDNATYCEGLFLLKQGIEAAGEVSAAGFRAAVEGFGDRYVPVSTFTTRWGPARHDAVAAVRDLHYATDCECWEYEGPIHPVVE